MKKALITFIGIAAVGGSSYLLLNQDDQMIENQPAVNANEISLIPESVEEEESTEFRVNTAFESKIDSAPVEVIEVDEAALEAGQIELSLLVEEYNENLGNLERRGEIEKQFTQKSEEYRKQVLAKVKQLNQNN